MSSSNDAAIPIDAFLPPGSVTVTDAALAVAKGFEEAVRKARPDVAWIVVFDWWDDWSASGVKQAPRLGMSAYEPKQMPEGVTQKVDSVTFAITIPREVYDAAKEKRIDVADDGSTQVTLK
jgi:hypothetical protein